MTLAIPRKAVGRGETGREPPLRNGDRLTRDEFERRFDATPDLRRAELIEGRVYVSPPASYDDHGRPHGHIVTLLGTYSAGTPGTGVAAEGSVRLDLDNMPQPDGFLLILPSHGGQARIGADDYVEGAPELVVEVAATSANYDLHEKLQVYRRNGVREYVVWRTFDRAFDYFILRRSQYAPHAQTDGVFRSEVFPGLWLDTAALLRGDLAAALATLNVGLAAPEHAAFVDQLEARAARPHS